MLNDNVTREHYRWAEKLLGALVSAPAIVGLVQHGTNIKLNWGFYHFLSFYRSIATPLIDFVEWPLREGIALLHLYFQIPVWLKDLHTISFVLAAIFVRANVRPIDLDQLSSEDPRRGHLAALEVLRERRAFDLAEERVREWQAEGK